MQGYHFVFLSLGPKKSSRAVDSVIGVDKYLCSLAWSRGHLGGTWTDVGDAPLWGGRRFRTWVLNSLVLKHHNLLCLNNLQHVLANYLPFQPMTLLHAPKETWQLSVLSLGVSLIWDWEPWSVSARGSSPQLPYEFWWFSRRRKDERLNTLYLNCYKKVKGHSQGKHGIQRREREALLLCFLLGKWKEWRILFSGTALWHQILVIQDYEQSVGGKTMKLKYFLREGL